MGAKYFTYRLGHEIATRSGQLKRKFPIRPVAQSFISLSEWREKASPFFFDSKTSLVLEKSATGELRQAAWAIHQGKIRFFSATQYDLGRDYDWVTNPETGYRYDIHQHWTAVQDFSESSGDIKYVWEKSRFAFLYDLIRYDYHAGEDQSELVFYEIESWMSANPINQGPNYKCSQEISLRVLNWVFALYYYKHAPSLTEARFQRMMHFVHWQIQHVYGHIDFSRIAVRNNHAITETLALYLVGTLFPFFPDASHWRQQGKAWFEEEIEYQVYKDGTYLQFSHNYHRVVLQLMTWAFYLAKANGDKFSAEVYERAKASLRFLFQSQDQSTGQLPNYGANDGALFFKLSDNEYRDFRPQLGALYYFFTGKALYPPGPWSESVGWYAPSPEFSPHDPSFCLTKQTTNSFEIGGFFVINEAETTTHIRCGSYKDRPSHADNLHLDIWFQGENILRDAGTYKYNTDKVWMDYFTGTKAHNTVMLGQHSQMKKGPRFIWLNWTQAKSAKLWETASTYQFQGSIKAFGQLGKDIIHERSVVQQKGIPHWLIKDEVRHQTGLPLRQVWNVSEYFLSHFEITAQDGQGNRLTADIQPAWYSSHYGLKEEAKSIVFQTMHCQIETVIQKKN